MDEAKPDKQVLIDIVSTKMPFGKYAGRLLCDVPEYYYVWFKNKGWPPGKIGFLMQNTYEIKISGLDPLLYKVKEIVHKHSRR